METLKNRSVLPDVLKLISCFGVLIIHISGHGLSDIPMGTFDWYVCTFWDSISRFAVPMFFMCTGALMLNPKKELSIKRLYKDYFFRVLRILLFWAWAYYIFTVLGQVFLYGWLEPNALLNSIVETLRFNHHLHLYYLQILLLFYVCLPIMKIFIAGASDKQVDYALIVWFVLGIFLPQATKYFPFSYIHGISQMIEINMTWSALGYAVLGYRMYNLRHNSRNLWIYIATFFLGFAFTFGMTSYMSISSGILNTDFLEGMSFGPCLMCIGSFGTLKILLYGKNSTPKLAKLVEASFTIYLIHHFFVMVFRQIGFNVVNFAPIIQIPFETLLIFGLSYIGWLILSRIPFVKDYLI